MPRGSVDVQHLSGVPGSVFVLSGMLFCVYMDTKFYCNRFLVSDNTDLINGVHSLLLMDVILLCSLHALVYMGETRDFQLFH